MFRLRSNRYIVLIHTNALLPSPGSGKTFTMMGSNPSDPADVEVNAGLYVLVARDIFESLKLHEYHHLKVLTPALFLTIS